MPEYGYRSNHDQKIAEPLAQALGWFSIGLGLAQVLAPRSVARVAGLPEHDALMRMMGMREIVNGLGIFAEPRPSMALWSRVMGDAMDLSLMGAAFASQESDKGRLAIATAAVAGIAALDLACAQRLSQDRNDRAVRVQSVTINRPVEEVYAFWRNLENLPRFMKHLISVREYGDGKSHWIAKGPAGTQVEWDAQMIHDQAPHRIAWRSLEGSDIENAGSVRFKPAPGDRGTEVHIKIAYDPPAGIVGATVAKLFGEEPGQQLKDDLRRFKQVMELGEVVHSDASIHTGMYPARPPEDDEETLEAGVAPQSYATGLAAM